MSGERDGFTYRVRISWPACAVACVVLLAGAVGYRVLLARQEGKIRAAAIRTVETLKSDGEKGLAVRHLDEYLAGHPRDVDALRLKAGLVDRPTLATDELLDVAKVYESIIRLDPDGAQSQAARRRLVELYLEFGDALRRSAAYYEFASLATLESRYHVAEVHARQLVARGASDSGAHRLLARALDGLAVPGDLKALNDAVREYRIALQADPADTDAATRLAELYRVKMKDPVRAGKVLDDLLAAQPQSLNARLARHRFYFALRQDDRAGTELDAAVKLEPDNPECVLAATEFLLRRGDNAGARARYAKIPQALRAEPRVAMLQGLIDFGAERPDEAVDAWRKGLVSTSGTDAELSWWLAYALLQLDRVREAGPLVAQYRRLAGDEAPLARLLSALLDERTGRPLRAARKLEQSIELFDESWRPVVLLNLGRCYEALFDEHKAAESYRRALKADARAVVPRLSLARLRLQAHPDDAVQELRSGLNLVPDDPALLAGLAGALLRVEGNKPEARRSFEEFDRALASAAKVSGADSPGLVLLAADRLNLAGQQEQAIEKLQKAVAVSPRSAALAVALAEALLRRGRFDRAIDTLTKAVRPEAAGDVAALRIARANILATANRGREARAALGENLGSLPESERPKVWVALGQLEAKRGNVASARAVYADWARLIPADPRPRLVLADLAIEQRDEPGLQSAVDALKESGGADDIGYRLARAKQLLFEREAAAPPDGSRDISLEEAARLVDSVIDDAPQLPAAQLLHARILEKQGRDNEAIPAYERLWGRGESSALPRLVELLARAQRFDALTKLRSAGAGMATQVDLLSAQAFVRVGDATQAGRIAELVARDLPDSPEALAWQARMLTLLGRFEDAESALRAMAERHPADIEPWLALIRYQASRQRKAAAAEATTKALKAVKSERPMLLKARLAWAAGERPAADAAFTAALERKPPDADSYTYAARYYEETERPGLATSTLEALLTIDPKNRPAARQLATLLSARAGDTDAWERAWALVDPAASGGDAPEDRLARAVVLSRSADESKRKAALETLEALTSDLAAGSPTASAAREFLARLLIDAGQAGRASEVASVSASPGGDASAVALYAEALIRNRRPDAAAWQVDRLAALSPGDPREAGLRARLQFDPERPVEAASALERAWAVRETSPGSEALGREVFSLLINLPGPDPSATAERVGRKLAARNPALSWMPAAVLARKGHTDDALELLKKALRPGRSEDLRETGRVAMRIAAAAAGAEPETLRKVGEVLTQALALDPESDDLVVMTAMLRHLQRDFNAEARLYGSLLERRPDSYVALNNLAWALCEGLKRPAEALPLADRLVQSSGRDPEALDTRGVILTRLARYEQAIRDLEQVVSLSPTGLHHFHLARAYLLAGQSDPARKSRELALSSGLSPDGLDPSEVEDFRKLKDQ